MTRTQKVNDELWNARRKLARRERRENLMFDAMALVLIATMIGFGYFAVVAPFLNF